MIALNLLCALMFVLGCVFVVTGIKNKLPWEELQPYGTEISNSRIGNRYFAFFIGIALFIFSIVLFIKI